MIKIAHQKDTKTDQEKNYKIARINTRAKN